MSVVFAALSTYDISWAVLGSQRGERSGRDRWPGMSGLKATSATGVGARR